MDAGEDGELTCAHMLLGMWEVKESAAHKVLAALGFDDEKAKQVAKTVSLNPNLQKRNGKKKQPLLLLLYLTLA